jgi:hypothetical protein
MSAPAAPQSPQSPESQEPSQTGQPDQAVQPVATDQTGQPGRPVQAVPTDQTGAAASGTGATQRRRARASNRRGGYAASIVVNLLMLVLINTWPGWQAVPFLTASTVLVVGAVNASIVARAVADLVNLIFDLPRLRALGDIVSICFGLVALVRIWQVFPLDVIGTGWETVARVVLVLGFFGSIIGIIEAFVRFVRGRFPGE